MARGLMFLLLVGLTCSCRSPYNIYAPYGPQCVPPPATGTIGQPYYQPNYQPYYPASPYGTYQGYPAPTPYSTGATPTYPAPTAGVLPSTYSQPAYAGNQGGWSSSLPYGSWSDNSTSVAVHPRPSGQFFSSNSASQLRINEQLPWTGNVRASGSYANSSNVIADPIPAYYDANAVATYATPIRPSIVRSQATSYEAPVVYETPAYYGTDYGVEPSYNAAIGTTDVISAGPAWTPRR